MEASVSETDHTSLIFKIKVADAKLLRDMITAISILVDEATFNLAPEGVKLHTMDLFRVTRVDFERRPLSR